jgi:indoleamine 2,3-dioxygenase
MNESWFYLVSIVIEARGAPILPLMLGAMRAAQVGDVATVTESLQRFEQYLADLTATMQRIYESCDPFLFYHRIRPFLAGSKNMAEAGLPRGVLYEDGTGDKQYRQYSGGSNAQSSLIQFFDIVLGVEHRPTTSKHHNIPYDNTNNPSKQDNFILQMRSYMPGKHARFLEDTSRVSNIRPFVEKHDNYELSLAYDACLAMLTAFRDQHIAIVTRYIIIPSKDIRACGRSFSSKVGMPSENIAKATTSSEPQAQQGTGGTVLIPFLKQTRDETKKHTILDRKRRSLGE